MRSNLFRPERIQAIFFLVTFFVLLATPARAIIMGAVSAQADVQPRKQDKNSAMEAISGSPWPGIIDHLLKRPLSDDPDYKDKASININYPSLGNKAIDADIRGWVTNLADMFESHLDASQFSVNQGEPESEGFNFLQDDDLNSEFALKEMPARNPFELFGNYTISRPSKAAVSVTFELWNYINNNQGNLDILTLNYNLLNNQRLEFIDVFENPDLALQLMSQWSRKKLEKRLGAAGNSQALLNGTSPLLENFSSLTLVPEGVCINFQPYQVGPWEAGMQKVLMPLDELRPAGPLLALWGK